MQPNPVNDFLTFGTDYKFIFDTIQFIDMKGRQIKTISKPRVNKTDVHNLAPGTYIIKCHKGDEIYEGKFIKK